MMKVNLALKVDDVLKNTTQYHAKYYSVKTFGGPSLYFHRRALGFSGKVNAVIRNELIYAVLTSWGMHRMGRNGSKMQPFDVFEKSVQSLLVQIDAVNKRQNEEKFCRVVQPKEIEENNYNLNITRYVDTFEEEEEVDIEANLREMAEIDAELEKLEKEMAGHLKKLGIIK